MPYDPRGGDPIRIDTILTRLSIEISNAPFVGNVLFPEVPVENKSDKYRIHDPKKRMWGPQHNSVRAPGATANEIPGLTTATDSYFVVEHALQIFVADEELENSGVLLEPIQDATRLVTGKLELEKELEIKDLATTAANYESGLSTTLVGNQQWDQYSTSDPMGVIRAAHRAIHAQLRTRTNTAIIPWLVMSWLTDHPDFIERIRYVQAGVLTEDLVASMLDVGRVVVPEAGYNSAELGLDPSISYIWPDDVVLAYVPPRVSPRMIGYGLNFVQPIAGKSQVVDRRRDDDRIGQVIRVRTRRDLVTPTRGANGKQIAGYVIKDVLS